MPTIGSLLVDLRMRTAKFEQGSRKVNSRLKRMERSAVNLRGAMSGIVGAATLAGFASMTRSALQTADAIGKTSDRLGISTKALQELRFAASQTGVSTEKLEMALQRMTRRVAEAANDTGEAKDAIKELGLDASALAKLSPDQIFRQLSEAMEGVTNQGDRVRLAMKLFDSEGVALVNTMRGGAKQLDEFSRTAEQMGLVLDEQLVRNAEKANDQMDVLAKVISTQTSTAVLALAPQITELSSALANAARNAAAFWDSLNDTPTTELGIGIRLTEIQDQIDAIEARAGRSGRNGARQGDLGRLRALRQEFERLDAKLRELRGTATPTADDPSRPSNSGPIVLPQLPKKEAGGKSSTTNKISEVEKLIQTLRTQSATLGLTEDQMLRYEAAQVLATGATTAQRAEINQLVEQIILERAVLEETADATDDLAKDFESATSQMSAFAEEAARNIQSSFADFLFDPFEDGLDGMLNGFITTIRRMGAELLSSQILNSVGGSLSGNSGFAGQIGASLLGVAGGSGGNFAAASASLDDVIANSGLFAMGGIMTAKGPAKLRTYASGGIANSPQLAVFGEGSTPEAFVPLPDGRRIPVDMQGGSGVTVNQYITTPDASSFRRSKAAIASDVSRSLAVAR